jgi:hypothetical protein
MASRQATPWSSAWFETKRLGCESLSLGGSSERFWHLTWLILRCPEPRRSKRVTATFRAASFQLQAQSGRQLNLWQGCHKIAEKSSKIVPLGAPHCYRVLGTEPRENGTKSPTFTHRTWGTRKGILHPLSSRMLICPVVRTRGAAVAEMPEPGPPARFRASKRQP